MLDTTFQLLLYSLPPALVMAMMGIVGVGIRVGPKWNSAILHFAGGVVIAVVGVELIPEILEQHNPAATCIGFTLGGAAMLAIRFLLPSADAPGGGIPKSLLTGTGVDLFIDGLIIGIGLAAGARQGFLISVALSVEAVSLGLATATTLQKRGLSGGQSISVTAGLGSLFVLGAVGGGLPLRGLSGPWLDGVLAFGAAALLFLAAEELISEAHESSPDTPWLTGSFLFGFLVILLFDLV